MVLPCLEAVQSRLAGLWPYIHGSTPTPCTTWLLAKAITADTVQPGFAVNAPENVHGLIARLKTSVSSPQKLPMANASLVFQRRQRQDLYRCIGLRRVFPLPSR